MDLSSKSRIYTYTYPLAGNNFNDYHDFLIMIFTRSKRQGHNESMLGFIRFKKDKFNCLSLTIEMIAPVFGDESSDFTYKTCKTLNSEPMMRETFEKFVDHFGKKYKNQDDYNFRFKVS